MAVSDLTVSTLDILFVLAVAEFIRTQLLTDGNKDWAVHKCVQEFVAVFELCVVVCELGIILNTNGIWVFTAYIFLAFLWWNLRWTNATASHFQPLEDWFQGNSDFISAVLISLAGACGGMVYYRYFVVTLWGLWQRSSVGAGPVHESKLGNPSCQSSIKVAIIYATLIEGVGVLLLRLVAKVMAIRNWNRYLVAFIQATLTTQCVFGALVYTGGYFNPALATSSQYGCTGSNPYQKALVFWISPTLGALTTYALWYHTPLRSLFNTRTE